MSHTKVIGIPQSLWLADPNLCVAWARPLQQQLQEWKVLERRVAKGVNLANERGRYTQTCEQVEATAASLAGDLGQACGAWAAWERCWQEERLPSITLPSQYLDTLAKRHWELQVVGKMDPRLGKSITSPELLATRARLVMEAATAESPVMQQWKRCSELLTRAGWGLVESPLSDEAAGEPRHVRPAPVPMLEIDYQSRDDLFVMEKFLRQGLSTYKANQQRLRHEVRLALSNRSRVNAQNQGHEITTTILSEFVMAQKGEPVAYVRIGYRDGSEARPFPLRCLRAPKVNADKRLSLSIALMSMRHLELDDEVKAVWFRNLEGSGRGTTAESDERLYELSVARLAELESAYGNQLLAIRLFHTGLEPAIIGFYRALVESLLAEPDREPWVIVQPCYFRRNGFELGTAWPNTPAAPVANAAP